ncbi:sushi, von Willebrand factor type A, EGF and pentraxin domain-containing protein 1-like isoform X2 [Stegodyphus dumicola]|uniref:sushi, von Willebrand factor type A, EGF and pentraxin domain-containing protein 1-like isoform X2 n=1 Tax=Stegodyphus dumicola TaxID=202533 RepID=UPI0015AA5D41|nr:sushi, von Willebrand factor type A, EGF and pentraxin domain-containing protein 1-like isoform X2 [Stegodyphus dumicola]
MDDGELDDGTADCRRDREKAEANGRQCLRKCKNDSDCISAKKRCLCDGLCGLSCVRPDLHCQPLLPPQNGKVQVIGEMFGQKVTYGCNEGYWLFGNSERVCQGDFTWSGSDPECKIKGAMCGSLPLVPHAKHSAPLDKSDFPIDSMVQYSCFPGYDPRGFPKAKCLHYNGTAQWFGPDFHCIPRNCSPLGEIEHGRRDGNTFTFTSRVTYHCNVGYELVGRAHRYCQANGKWSAILPSCRPVQCPIPADPPNGRALYTSVSYNSVVKYECRYGYRLVGPATRTCNTSKQWEGSDPTCEEIVCEDPGPFYNGYFESRSYSLGSNVIFRCFDGMKMEGSPATTCEEDGNWSQPIPKCLAPCIVPEMEQGNFTDYPPGARVLHGLEINITCENRYDVVHNSTPVVCNNGTWTHVPACVPVYCPYPGVLEHGRVLLVGYMGMYDYRPYVKRVTNNRQIMYECHRHYTLKDGPPGATCVDGQWSPKQLPRCVRGSHPVLTTQRRRRRELFRWRMRRLDIRDVENKEEQSKEILINANCHQLPEKPKHGLVVASGTDHGVKVFFICKKGYQLIGSNVTECYDGQWTTPTPVCRDISCPYPGVLKHGRILTVGYTSTHIYIPYVTRIGHNQQIIYDCHHHYTLEDGPPFATCIDGQWSPKEMPRCVSESHPDLATHRRRRELFMRRRRRGGKRKRRGKGARSKERIIKEPCSLGETNWMEVEIIKMGRGNDSLPHGTVINVTCSEGHKLNIGNRTARCVRGKWKPKEPVCETLTCLVPSTPNGIYNHLQRTLIENEEVPHSEILTFTCLPGFELMGVDSLRCWYGNWAIDNFPYCAAKPCELPVIPQGHYLGGYRSGLTISHGSSIDYNCKPDYVRVSEEAIYCSEGILKPHSPACQHHSLKQVSVISPDSDSIQETDIRPGGNGMDMPPGSGWRSCGPPERQQNTLLYPTHKALSASAISVSTDPTDSEQSGQTRWFAHNTEVRFNCIRGIYGEKTTWKIVCENGNWVGGAYKCEAEPEPPPDEDRRNKSCIFYNTEPNLVAFLGDQMIEEEETEHPPHTELVFRCKDIGKYSLIGSVRRRCVHGDWDGVKPSCYGLSQENDYALEKPPTILFRHQLGPIAQSNEGKLIVYPGTILHLECLWIRKYGIPHWQVSHSYRKYPEGWTNEVGRDPQLEYRLSIYHAQKDDSGRFTCITPMGHRHSVDIVVAAVHCPQIPPTAGLQVSNPSTKLDTKVVFSCREGQTLLGSEQATCLPSGNWSAEPPLCQVTECPDLTNDTSELLIAEVSGRTVGSKATFSCPTGYGLRGDDTLQCLDTGQWSAAVPYCEEVICESPETPKNGFLQSVNKDKYRGGDVLQYACDANFMMNGTPIIICQESSRWSGPVPTCVAACQYPGTTQGATISNVQFFYSINETVTFNCPEGFELRGAKMLRCLEDGRWSSETPSCHSTRKG